MLPRVDAYRISGVRPVQEEMAPTIVASGRLTGAVTRFIPSQAKAVAAHHERQTGMETAIKLPGPLRAYSARWATLKAQLEKIPHSTEGNMAAAILREFKGTEFVRHVHQRVMEVRALEKMHDRRTEDGTCWIDQILLNIIGASGIPVGILSFWVLEHDDLDAPLMRLAPSGQAEQEYELLRMQRALNTAIALRTLRTGMVPIIDPPRPVESLPPPSPPDDLPPSALPGHEPQLRERRRVLLDVRCRHLQLAPGTPIPSACHGAACPSYEVTHTAP